MQHTTSGKSAHKDGFTSMIGVTRNAGTTNRHRPVPTAATQAMTNSEPISTSLLAVRS